MDFNFKLINVEWLKELDDKYEDGLQVGLEEIAREFEGELIKRSPKDYVTAAGRAKGPDDHFANQWDVDIDMNHLQAYFDNPTPYGPILEKGLYENVGPRTIAGRGGIYSRQALGGIVEPLISDDKYIEKMMRELETSIGTELDDILTRR